MRASRVDKLVEITFKVIHVGDCSLQVEYFSPSLVHFCSTLRTSLMGLTWERVGEGKGKGKSSLGIGSAELEFHHKFRTKFSLQQRMNWNFLLTWFFYRTPFTVLFYNPTLPLTPLTFLKTNRPWKLGTLGLGKRTASPMVIH